MSTSEQNMDNGPQGSPTPVPWQRRPWVWAVLGALLVLIGYLIGSCFREPGPDLTADASREELLFKAQQGVNDGLQAEIDRLRGLLAGDVCQEEHAAPLYNKPLPESTGPGEVVPQPEEAKPQEPPSGPEVFSVPANNATIEPLPAPENLQKPETLAALAEQAMGQVVLYQLQDKELALVEAMAMEPGTITVTPQGLTVQLLQKTPQDAKR